MTQLPEPRRLLLLGGGHAHVAVLKAFEKAPIGGLTVVLVSRQPLTPYSGMVPGCISGRYSEREAHLDLVCLSARAGVEFVQGEVKGLDLPFKEVLLDTGQRIPFDLLSVNTGSTPDITSVPCAKMFVTPIKPIDRFLVEWNRFLSAVVEPQKPVPVRIAVVGGGAGGIELAVAIHERSNRDLAEGRRRGVDQPISTTIIHAGNQILPTHGVFVRSTMARALKEIGIQLQLGQSVIRVRERELELANGQCLTFDKIFWATQASAPHWIKDSGIATDDRGFIAVNETLQSVSSPEVFGAGDVVSMAPTPCPKAGVYAVRQGPILAENLRRFVLQRPLLSYQPQRRFLSLITAGRGTVIASWGPFAARGKWLAHLKHRIDKQWMHQYCLSPKDGY